MINSEIRILLQSIAIQTRKNYAQQLREIGLHIGQELALYHLWEKDGITQSQLRNKIGSKASTVSNMLRKLEADGIVYRKLDDRDHRISNVFLTEKGKELKIPIIRIWRNHEQAMFKGIHSEELILMKSVLQRIADNLTEQQ